MFRLFSAFVLIGCLLAASCQPKNNDVLTVKLDSVAVLLKTADENLAVDPAKLQLRVDSMTIEKLTIDSFFPRIEARKDEISMAYNIYNTALIVFSEYLKQYPSLMLSVEQYQKEEQQLRKQITSRDENEQAKLLIQTDDLLQRALVIEAETKQLIRNYIDIIRPFKRKRKVVDHMYNQLKIK